MTQLKIHNTLSGEKEKFVPVDPAHIRIYACGPTVYDYAHIGNGRMAVVFDQLARLLRILYPKVTYASNITDVEDKIIDAAQKLGEPIDAVTNKFADIYNNDMAMMGVLAPDIQPRATDHIEDMVAQIGSLIQAGHAYEADGHVLFDVPSFENYGRLSRRSRDDQIAGARVEIAPYKKDAADFVLWKPSSDDQPGWNSPWGRGRPGWHIECSAMSERHLGLPFDIHGGGADLKFPHHENEIAQSCCAHGNEDNIAGFSKYWMHNGFVTVEGEKMSKSLGNFTLVHDLIDRYPGEVLRMTLLSAHYRQPLDWSEKAIQQSKHVLDRFYNILKDVEDVGAEDTDMPEEMLNALCDDLNTPQAFAVINALAKQAAVDKTPLAKGRLLAAANNMGLLECDPNEWLGYGQTGDDVDASVIEKLLADRQQARADKDFARADEIRDELDAMGIEIEDTPNGPKWRKAG